MPNKFPDIPLKGDVVYFYDDDKRAYVAIVAFVHSGRKIKGTNRPICNLAIFKHDGRVANRVDVGPAHFNNKIWKVVGKWSWPDEVPSKDFNDSPSPEMRNRRVGLGESITTT